MAQAPLRQGRLEGRRGICAGPIGQAADVRRQALHRRRRRRRTSASTIRSRCRPGSTRPRPTARSSAAQRTSRRRKGYGLLSERRHICRSNLRPALAGRRRSRRDAKRRAAEPLVSTSLLTYDGSRAGRRRAASIVDGQPLQAEGAAGRPEPAVRRQAAAAHRRRRWDRRIASTARSTRCASIARALTAGGSGGAGRCRNR